MVSSNRRQFLTSTVLDQDFLDQQHDALYNKLEMIVNIEAPKGFTDSFDCTFAIGLATITTTERHGFINDELVVFSTTSSLPPELVAGTSYFVVATTDLTFEVSATEGGAAIVMTGLGLGTHSVISSRPNIRASDRNKWIVQANQHGIFYEALLNIPTIRRTVGEFLDPKLTFSKIKLVLSNVDERFNPTLPSGNIYANWVDKEVEVKLGLAEVNSTYTTIFKGRVTDTGGFSRSTEAITITARDENDRSNKSFPTTVFNKTTYPKIGLDDIGKNIPVIYGNWTTELDPFPAIVPVTVVNKGDPFATFEAERTLDISVGSPAVGTLNDHRFDNDDEIEFTTSGALPAPLAVATKYFIVASTENLMSYSNTLAGPPINTTAAGSGNFNIKPWQAGAAYADISCVISDNDLSSLDDTNVFLRRAGFFTKIPSSEITVGAFNKSFTIKQNTATLWLDGAAYKYENSDEFFVRCVGKSLGGGGVYTDNIIEQARDLLKVYGGLPADNFDVNWDTYRDKATPAESAISLIKSRIWVQDEQKVMQYALSLLEQVRLEAFFERTALKFKILSMHFDDFDPTPSHVIRNWDIVERSFKPKIDDRSSSLFNRGQGVFSFFPIINEQGRSTVVFRNSAAITQHGKEITKSVVYPNLYITSDAENQYRETLKIASSTLEIIETGLTWRSMLKDIGDFVRLDVKIGSAQFDEVPAMIRSIAYDSAGIKIIVKLFSFQMVPFGTYSPGYFGIVGGESASITVE